MNMGIHAARRHDLAFASDRFGGDADGYRHVRLNIRIPGFANRKDPAVFNADIRFDDPPVIDDQRIGDHQIHAILRRHLPLAHAVADHFTATEFHLFAIGG